MYKKTIFIPKKDVALYEKYLDGGDAFPDVASYSTVETYTADFGNGYEADIKVCAADDCSLFVDAVLFHDSAEVCLAGDVSYGLVGSYFFEAGDEVFEVEVVAA